MANTTFSGPVRSENGFQEWDGTAWVPVAGGGGGGTTFVDLGDSSTEFYGVADNRYSDNSSSPTPTGPTAGTIIQLPVIEVNQSYTTRIILGGASVSSAWALRLPTIPGTALSAFIIDRYSANYATGIVAGTTGDVYSPAVYYSGVCSGEGPVDTLYLYGVFDPAAPLVITRVPNLEVPELGEVAMFIQTGIPTMSYGSPYLPHPFIYPFTNILAP